MHINKCSHTSSYGNLLHTHTQANIRGYALSVISWRALNLQMDSCWLLTSPSCLCFKHLFIFIYAYHYTHNSSICFKGTSATFHTLLLVLTPTHGPYKSWWLHVVPHNGLSMYKVPSLIWIWHIYFCWGPAAYQHLNVINFVTLS